MVESVQSISSAAPPAAIRSGAAVSGGGTRVADAAEAAPVASPRINIDPVVGVIVQFLNPSGSVESQVPSFAAEAYLRVGLTVEGYRKADESAHTELTV